MTCETCGEPLSPQSAQCSRCGATVVRVSLDPETPRLVVDLPLEVTFDESTPPPGAPPPTARLAPTTLAQPRPRAAAWIGVVAALLVTAGGLAAMTMAGDDASDTDQSAREDPAPGEAPSSTAVEATTSTSVAPMSDEMVVAEHGNAVHRIESSGCGVQSSGTGFAIDQTHLVTNKHVVDVDPTPMVYARNGASRSGRVIGWSEDPDIAVIEVEEPLTEFVTWAPTDDLSEGQSVIALGYPVPDMEFAVQTGTLVSFKREGDRRVAIRTDATVDHGSSGGPILTQRGEVAGVVTEFDANPDGEQLAPLAFTALEVEPVVASMLASPGDVVADCEYDYYYDAPDSYNYGDGSYAYTFGDDPYLDSLWLDCEAGFGASCETLYWESPVGSRYEQFGATCGDRFSIAGAPYSCSLL